jgi:hypothetical protein
MFEGQYRGKSKYNFYLPVETERQLSNLIFERGESYSPSHLVTSEKERETGWFSIYRGR